VFAPVYPKRAPRDETPIHNEVIPKAVLIPSAYISGMLIYPSISQETDTKTLRQANWQLLDKHRP
jgi:hypothetical protein